MNSMPRSLVITVLLAAVSGLCLALGFGLGRFSRSRQLSQSRQPVVIYDDKVRAEYQRSFDEFLAELHVEELETLRGMKPVVQGGPFRLFMNDATGDFVIYRDRTVIALETTDGDETTTTYYGRAQHAYCNFIFRKGTNEYLSSMYVVNSDGQNGGPRAVKLYYVDRNGDGHFDHFKDFATGQTYELKDMQWIPTNSSVSPVD